jgi:VWFA-related protein
MTFRAFVFAALAVLAGSAALAGAIPQGVLSPASPPGNDTTTASADTVGLDAIFTDRSNRRVRDLRASDLEIRDSGEQRLIESIDLRRAGGGRLLAIFLDEYHVSAGDNTVRVRAALRQFVDTALKPGDLVAIMKPLDPLNTIQISQDRDVIHAAIDSFTGRKGDYAPRTPFEEKFISRSPRSADASRAQVVTSAVQALAVRIGELRGGRKAVVLVSEGFTPALPRGSDRLMGGARAIVHAANRFGVSIYPISPRIGTDDGDPDRIAATLQLLAEQTGGAASLNQGNLDPGLRRVIEDLDDHYVVTYRVQRTSDGRFHPIELRVKRDGVQVRTRAGYWAANPVMRPSGAIRASFVPARPPHTSPYIRPWIGVSRGAEGLTSVSVTWDAGQAPPRGQLVDSVALKVTADDGRVIFQERIAPSQVATFDTRPGNIHIEMAVQGANSNAIDTDYRRMQVRDLRVTGPTFASVQLLRTRTARTFAAVSNDPKAVPSPAREFSRAERLLVRVPVYGPNGASPAVKATLLNRAGVPMRPLTQVPAALPDGVVQFDLPLSWLAPEEYRVEMVATTGTQEAREVVLFRVTD